MLVSHDARIAPRTLSRSRAAASRTAGGSRSARSDAAHSAISSNETMLRN
jgi:hypothetical protein